jgi:hypothetical protein
MTARRIRRSTLTPRDRERLLKEAADRAAASASAAERREASDTRRQEMAAERGREEHDAARAEAEQFREPAAREDRLKREQVSREAAIAHMETIRRAQRCEHGAGRNECADRACRFAAASSPTGNGAGDSPEL